MAQNTKDFIVRVVSTGSKEAVRELEQLNNVTDKNVKGSKDMSVAAAEMHRALQGTAHTTGNTTKAFSKMAQSMTGTIVPIYATVAANAFALTAAFRALSDAMDVSIMIRAADQFSQRMGVNLIGVAENIKELTGNAISMDEALRHASLASAAGFNTKTIDNLTKVATNASKALGRDLNDSMQRVFKGVVKAEPELLDELGIILRLDAATSKYAAQVGKAATELTTFEKQQAVANEVIRQANDSFGDLSSTVDTNPYTKLAGSLRDASVSIFNAINTIVAPVMDFLASNSIALGAVIAAFAASIAKLAIPALTSYGSAASVAAVESVKLVEALKFKELAKQSDFLDELENSVYNALGRIRSSISKGTAQKFADAFDSGVRSPETINKLASSIQGAITRAGDSNTVKFGGSSFARGFLEDVVKELRQFSKASSGGGVTLSQILFSDALVDSFGDKMSLLFKGISAKVLDFRKTLVDAKIAFSSALTIDSFSSWVSELKNLNTTTIAWTETLADGTEKVVSYTAKLGILGTTAKLTGLALRGMLAVVNLVPVIGALIAAFSALSAGLDFLKSKLAPTAARLSALADEMEDLAKKTRENTKGFDYYSRVISKLPNDMDSVIKKNDYLTKLLSEVSGTAQEAALSLSSIMEESKRGNIGFFESLFNSGSAEKGVSSAIETLNTELSRLADLGVKGTRELYEKLQEIDPAASSAAQSVLEIANSIEIMSNKSLSVTSATKDRLTEISEKLKDVNKSIEDFTNSFDNLGNKSQSALINIINSFREVASLDISNGAAKLAAFLKAGNITGLSSIGVEVENVRSLIDASGKLSLELDSLNKSRADLAKNSNISSVAKDMKVLQEMIQGAAEAYKQGLLVGADDTYLKAQQARIMELSKSYAELSANNIVTDLDKANQAITVMEGNIENVNKAALNLIIDKAVSKLEEFNNITKQVAVGTAAINRNLALVPQSVTSAYNASKQLANLQNMELDANLNILRAQKEGLELRRKYLESQGKTQTDSTELSNVMKDITIISQSINTLNTQKLAATITGGTQAAQAGSSALSSFNFELERLLGPKLQFNSADELKTQLDNIKSLDAETRKYFSDLANSGANISGFFDFGADISSIKYLDELNKQLTIVSNSVNEVDKSSARMAVFVSSIQNLNKALFGNDTTTLDLLTNTRDQFIRLDNELAKLREQGGLIEALGINDISAIQKINEIDRAIESVQEKLSSNTNLSKEAVTFYNTEIAYLERIKALEEAKSAELLRQAQYKADLSAQDTIDDLTLEIELMQTRGSNYEYELELVKKIRDAKRERLDTDKLIAQQERLITLEKYKQLKAENASKVNSVFDKYAKAFKSLSTAGKDISTVFADIADSMSTFGNTASAGFAEALAILTSYGDRQAQLDLNSQKATDARFAAEERLTEALLSNQNIKAAELEVQAAQTLEVKAQEEAENNKYATMQAGISAAISGLDKQSQAYAALRLAQVGVAVAEGVTAILSQGKGDPYTAFARMAAMAATVAGFLSEIGGSISASAQSGADQAQKDYTDSLNNYGVVGAKDMLTNALMESVLDLVGIQTDNFTVMRKLQETIAELNRTFKYVAGQLYKQYGSFDALSLNYPTITSGKSGFLGFSSSSTVSSLIGAGLSLSGTIKNVAGDFVDSLDEARTYIVTQTTTSKSSWWGLKKSTSTSINKSFSELDTKTRDALDSALDATLTTVEQLIKQLAPKIDSISYTAGDMLLDALASKLSLIGGFTFELDLDLKDKSPEEAAKLVGAAFSKLGNDFIESFLSWINDFAIAGEEALDTLARLAKQNYIVSTALSNVGAIANPFYNNAARYLEVTISGISNITEALKVSIASITPTMLSTNTNWVEKNLYTLYYNTIAKPYYDTVRSLQNTMNAYSTQAWDWIKANGYYEDAMSGDNKFTIVAKNVTNANASIKQQSAEYYAIYNQWLDAKARLEEYASKGFASYQEFLAYLYTGWNDTLMQSFTSEDDFIKQFDKFSQALFSESELAVYALNNVQQSFTSGIAEFKDQLINAGLGDIASTLSSNMTADQLRGVYDTLNAINAFSTITSNGTGGYNFVGAELEATLIKLGSTMYDLEEASKSLDTVLTDMTNGLANIMYEVQNDILTRQGKTLSVALRDIDKWMNETIQSANEYGASLEDINTIIYDASLKIRDAIIDDKDSIASLVDSLYYSMDTQYLQDQYDAAKELYDQEMQRYQDALDAIKRIKEFVDSILLSGDLSILTPLEKLTTSQTKYFETLAAATSGDSEALNNITQFAQDYLDQARAYYASSSDYVAIFNNVLSTLDSLSVSLSTIPEPVAPTESTYTSAIKTELDAYYKSKDVNTLAAKLGELSKTLDTSVFQLITDFNIPLDTFVSDFFAQSTDYTKTFTLFSQLLQTAPDIIANMLGIPNSIAYSLIDYINQGLDATTSSAVVDLNDKLSTYLGVAVDNLPSFDVGSANISRDMTANIHQGEMVIDPKSADVLRRYGIQVGSVSDTEVYIAGMLNKVQDSINTAMEMSRFNSYSNSGTIVVSNNSDVVQAIKELKQTLEQTQNQLLDQGRKLQDIADKTNNNISGLSVKKTNLSKVI